MNLSKAIVFLLIINISVNVYGITCSSLLDISTRGPFSESDLTSFRSIQLHNALEAVSKSQNYSTFNKGQMLSLAEAKALDEWMMGHEPFMPSNINSIHGGDVVAFEKLQHDFTSGLGRLPEIEAAFFRHDTSFFHSLDGIKVDDVIKLPTNNGLSASVITKENPIGYFNDLIDLSELNLGNEWNNQTYKKVFYVYINGVAKDLSQLYSSKVETIDGVYDSESADRHKEAEVHFPAGTKFKVEKIIEDQGPGWTSLFLSTIN